MHIRLAEPQFSASKIVRHCEKPETLISFINPAINLSDKTIPTNEITHHLLDSVAYHETYSQRTSKGKPPHTLFLKLAS